MLAVNGDSVSYCLNSISSMLLPFSAVFFLLMIFFTVTTFFTEEKQVSRNVLFISVADLPFNQLQCYCLVGNVTLGIANCKLLYRGTRLISWNLLFSSF